MKKPTRITLVVITALTLLAGSSFAFAEDKSASTTSSGSSTSTINEKNFQDRKAIILKRISDRLNKMQEIQSCVQSANDLKALHVCKSLKHKNHKDHHHTD